MAYLGNGIYDLLDVVKASNDPQINYEGLYQDPMPSELTYNPFKAMTPDYSFNNLLPRYFEKNPDMASPSGKFYDDLTLRGEFQRVNQGLPLYNRYYDIDRVGRFEDFNPRVGIINAGLPINNTNSITPINNTSMIEDYPIVSTTNEDETDQQYIQEQEPKGIAKLFQFLRNLPTPMNILRGGLESLQGFNQRIRNTDFGRSQTLAEYFQKRRERKQADRAQEAMPGVYESARRQGFTNDRGGFSTDRADDAGTSPGSGEFNPSSSRGRSGY